NLKRAAFSAIGIARRSTGRTRSDCCRALGLLAEAVALFAEGSVYRAAGDGGRGRGTTPDAPLSLTGEHIRADLHVSYRGLLASRLELSKAARELGGHRVKQALIWRKQLHPRATNGIIPRERRPLWLYSGSSRFSRSSWTTQVTEQRLCLLEVRGVEAFGEPIVDTGERHAPLVAAA